MNTASPTIGADQSEPFQSLAELRAACLDLPEGDSAAAAAVLARQAELTKPPGSLGRLEEIVAWLAKWGRQPAPARPGRHPGVRRQSRRDGAWRVALPGCGHRPDGGELLVRAAPRSTSSRQAVSATLRVIPLDLENPTADFTREPAMDEPLPRRCRCRIQRGAAGRRPHLSGRDGDRQHHGSRRHRRRLCSAEMARDGRAAAPASTTRVLPANEAAIDKALARHCRRSGRSAAVCSGARRSRTCRHPRRHACRAPPPHSGAARRFRLHRRSRAAGEARADALDHAQAAHVSAEAAHRMLLDELKLKPLLDLGMRLGEGSGAALAVSILRAALACHTGMATFAEAGVANKPH